MSAEKKSLTEVQGGEMKGVEEKSGAGSPDPSDRLMSYGDAKKLAGSIDRDKWAHRSELMRCKTCMFFVGKGARCFVTGFKIGRCRESSQL